MPAALSVHDAKTHVEHVEEWLPGERGERAVPEIEKAWPRGPIVELKIIAPQSARANASLDLRVTLSNNKVGHGFPTGPLNIARAWIGTHADVRAITRASVCAHYLCRTELREAHHKRIYTIRSTLLEGKRPPLAVWTT